MTTKQFSFPLNVYAQLLQQREGRVDFLHFAVFESAGDDVLRAQERASELLWQALPAPCRLLDVGIGLGTTLQRLVAAGYAAKGITPEQPQIDLARQRHGAGLAMECVRLEDFNGQTGHWDALLFQESAQYIEPFALLEAADRLLDPDHASLIVMDEFALRRSDAAHTGLHLLDHFIALAVRFGWRVVQHIDLSREVQPTLDYLLREIPTRCKQLMCDLAITTQAMEGLVAALTRSRAMYRDGIYGYALLRFERTRSPADRLVRVGDRHAGAVCALFGTVFGQTLSTDEWMWKYGVQRGCAVALQRGADLVAHYGGATREVRFHGRHVLACQVCDVMVDPRARADLARSGPLHRITATFLETQVGWNLPHLIGYGFPTERAMAVAERLALYAPVDSMVCLSWPALDARLRVSCRPLTDADLDEGSAAAVDIDRLWNEMAAALPEQTLGVRDARWIRHRYLRHPRLRYEVLLLRSRWRRAVVGLLVLRRHPQHLECVDMVCAPRQFGPLLAVARQRAAAADLPAVECWITQSQQHWLQALDPQTCSSRSLGIQVPANIHSPGPAADDLRQRWWLTAGDTDFR